MFTLAILVKHASDLDFFIHQETQAVVQTVIISIAFRDPSTIDPNPLDLDSGSLEPDPILQAHVLWNFPPYTAFRRGPGSLGSILPGATAL